MRKIAIMLLPGLLLCSCASSKRRHLGTWDATGIGQDRFTVNFIDKTAVEMTTPDGTFAGEYVIDYTQEPIRLDVMWDSKSMKCIMEFLGDDSFKVIGEDDPEKLRPISFNPVEDVVIFDKRPKKK